MTLPKLQGGQWDELWLGGAGELVKFPGIWSVTGSGIQRKIDEKNSKGASKASIQDEGDKAAKLTLEGMLWTDEQVAEFEQLLPTIHPRQTGGPKSPVDIYHPLTELLGIKQIYTHGIPIPKHEKKQGRLVLRFDVTEWLPKPKTDKAGGGGSGSAAQTAANLAFLAASLASLGNTSASGSSDGGEQVLKNKDPMDIMADSGQYMMEDS